MNGGKGKREEKKSNKLVDLNLTRTIITLNVNRLNASIKSQRFSALIIKQHLNKIYSIYKKHILTIKTWVN